LALSKPGFGFLRSLSGCSNSTHGESPKHDQSAFFFNNKLKASNLTQAPGGFTLIELLVAMILAALVITPLLGFMLNIMDTDRKEQAK